MGKIPIERVPGRTLKFRKATAIVLENEGGWVQHPSDPGGATNQGLTLGFLQSTRDLALCDMDGDGDIDVADVRLLDQPEEAAPIYEKYVWDRWSIEGYGDAVGLVMYDMFVNHSPRGVATIVQRAVNSLRPGTLAEDGGYGPRTVAAAQAANQTLLLTALLREREAYYRSLVRQDPKLGEFLDGWLNRVARLRDVIGRHYA